MKPVIFFALFLVFLSCNNGSETGKSGDTTNASVDTAFLNNTMYMPLVASEAKDFIKHFKDVEVDPYRAKAKFSDFDPGFLELLMKLEPEQVRFFYGAYLDDAKYGDKRNWPVLVLKVKFGGSSLYNAAAPKYYIASKICPPPEGTCDAEVE